MYTITLNDGTKIENLTMNGNNFITNESITREIFSGNLKHVKIESDNLPDMTQEFPDFENFDDISRTGEFENCELSHYIKDAKGRIWFVIREIPSEKLERMKIRADIEYLAMMTDNDI